ncbi:hypothetical protein [Longitalea luteola]|uniref:hypothetical protein n=1 Tax=Longitalea luteola TaxID=2812563 RepID=UPI001A978C48|nr:hypothetical protein [Longitalea luteola]
MKWVTYLLTGMLIAWITTVRSQQRLPNINGQDRLRLRDLNLSAEQKRRLALLIQRERMQYYLNQKELNDILTPKQKEQLMMWRERRNKSDSTKVKD